MVSITFKTNMRILFGDEIVGVEGGLGQIHSIIDELSQILIRRITSAFIPPKWIPTPENKRVEYLQSILHKTVDELISERLKQSDSISGRVDILSMLLQEIANQGIEVDIESIRGELLTLFVAGYETNN